MWAAHSPIPYRLFSRYCISLYIQYVLFLREDRLRDTKQTNKQKKELILFTRLLANICVFHLSVLCLGGWKLSSLHVFSLLSDWKVLWPSFLFRNSEVRGRFWLLIEERVCLPEKRNDPLKMYSCWNTSRLFYLSFICYLFLILCSFYFCYYCLLFAVDQLGQNHFLHSPSSIKTLI